MKEVTIPNVVSVLSSVFDPEVGINIVDLGLIYDISIDGLNVRIVMTMTTPACPMGPYLTQAAERAMRSQLPAVGSFQADIIWEPEWNPSMMSLEARRQMGWRA